MTRREEKMRIKAVRTILGIWGKGGDEKRRCKESAIGSGV